MKTNKIFIWCAFLSTTLFWPFAYGQADVSAYEKLSKERESVLVEILAMRRSKLDTHTETIEAVYKAELALYTFRRDAASSLENKIHNQKLIIGVYEKERDAAQVKLTIGSGDKIDVLIKTECVLREKQALELMELNSNPVVQPDTFDKNRR